MLDEIRTVSWSSVVEWRRRSFNVTSGFECRSDIEALAIKRFMLSS